MAELYFPELPDMPQDCGDQELLKLFYRAEQEAWNSTYTLRNSVNPLVDGLGLARRAKAENNAEIAAYLTSCANEDISSGMADYHKRLDAAYAAVENLRATLDKMRRIGA